MKPSFATAIAACLLSAPVAAQQTPSAMAQDGRAPGPFRIVNGTGQEGLQFYLVKPGEDWGPSRIGNPLAPGAALNLRASARAGCAIDVRLVLADGQEAVRRGHDICASPVVTLEEPGPAASGPRSPGLLRIENNTGQDAFQLYIAQGEQPWGHNRLSRALPSGDNVLQRAGSGANCRVHVRMVLADGREEVRRDQDICARPRLALGEIRRAAAPVPPPARGPAGRQSSGTGFIVAPERVVTNHHVVNGCTRLTLPGAGPTPLSARILRADARLDLALLEVPGLRGPALAFRAAPARRGEGVIALGFPLAGLLSTDLKLTRGDVNGLSGLGNDQDVLQMSAPVQPGNSGGPLLDLRGQVVGMVVAKLNAQNVARQTGDIAQNVNFAIKGEPVAAFLRAAGLRPQMGDLRGPERGAADIGDDAARSTAMIRCNR
jgi:S1-C subfamily serine protease